MKRPVDSNPYALAAMHFQITIFAQADLIFPSIKAANHVTLGRKTLSVWRIFAQVPASEKYLTLVIELSDLESAPKTSLNADSVPEINGNFGEDQTAHFITSILATWGSDLV